MAKGPPEKHTLQKKKKNKSLKHIPSLYVSYTLHETNLLKFDSRKAPFWLGNAVLRIKLFYVSYTLYKTNLLKFDSRKAPFWLGNAVLGIKFVLSELHFPSTLS